MIRRWPWAHPVGIGIAVARDQIVAAIPGDPPTAPWIRPLTPPGDSETAWPELAAALGELRGAVAARGKAAAGDHFRGELHVALLPPLGELRCVELPGLRVAEARQVLRREPSRYLARSADANPVELDVEAERWRQTSRFRMFAAPRAIIDAIHAAARESGWRLAGIVPAEGAWGAAASSLGQVNDSADRVLVICLEHRVDVVRMRDGHTLLVRRLPTADPTVAARVQSLLRDADGSARAGIAVVGDSPLADELRLTLGGTSDATRPDLDPAWSSRSPALLAAHFAARAMGPWLLPESERSALAQSARRASVVRFAAAAVLIAGAALLQLVGLSREHDAVAAERARLREPVTRALAVRDSLDRLSSRLATIRAASTAAPRWAPLLVALSARLPDDAFLLSLRADGDSLHVEGEAARAEGVFDALRGVRDISRLRPDGPIRQEIAEDGSTSERFTLSAAIAREP